MKNPCEVIRDLLPLFVDGVASKPSEEMVKKHLEECEKCKKIHENMIMKLDEPEIDSNYKIEIKPFKKVLRYIRTAVVTILCCSILFLGTLSYFYIYKESDLYLKIHKYKIECSVNEENVGRNSANQYIKEVLNVIMKKKNLSNDTKIRLDFFVDKNNYLSYFMVEFHKGNKIYVAENIDDYSNAFEINLSDNDDFREPQLTITEWMDMLDILHFSELRKVEGSTLEVTQLVDAAKSFKKVGINTEYVKIEESESGDTLLFEEFDADVKRGLLIAERSILDDLIKNVYVYKLE